jgi:hypothetical protein
MVSSRVTILFGRWMSSSVVVLASAVVAALVLWTVWQIEHSHAGDGIVLPNLKSAKHRVQIRLFLFGCYSQNWFINGM